MPNKISALVCMSSFKGTLTQQEACTQVARSLKKVGVPNDTFPVGDGGRGTLQCIEQNLGGDKETFLVSNPIREKVEATVLCLPHRQRPSVIYIESSETCGYHLIPIEMRDPMRVTSYGLGELLHQCLGKWKQSLQRIYIGLGDSAISDAGMGMLTAMGYEFHDVVGHPLWGDANGLRLIRSVRIPSEKFREKIRFTVLCDVLNPLCGPQGSAKTFAPQKGASREQVNLIEQGMENFAQVIRSLTGKNVAAQPMCGSAGGLAAAFYAFFQTELVQGARFLLDWVGFDGALKNHSFLITGEGKTDSQTLSGKAPMECIERAAKAGKKSVLVSGTLGGGYDKLLGKQGLVSCIECGAVPNPKAALSRKIKEVFKDKDFLKMLE